MQPSIGPLTSIAADQFSNEIALKWRDEENAIRCASESRDGLNKLGIDLEDNESRLAVHVAALADDVIRG